MLFHWPLVSIFMKNQSSFIYSTTVILYVICSFILTVFQIFFVLIFQQFDYNVSGCDFRCFTLIGVHRALISKCMVLTVFGKFESINLQFFFPASCLSSFPRLQLYTCWLLKIIPQETEDTFIFFFHSFLKLFFSILPLLNFLVVYLGLKYSQFFLQSTVGCLFHPFWYFTSQFLNFNLLLLHYIHFTVVINSHIYLQWL